MTDFKTAANAIFQAFKSRGIPQNLYRLNKNTKTLQINEKFLEYLRTLDFWKTLERDFTESGGTITVATKTNV